MADAGGHDEAEIRRYLAFVSAKIAACEQRADLHRVVGEAETVAGARAGVARLLGITEEAAQVVLNMRVQDMAQDGVASLRREHSDLLRALSKHGA